MKKLIPCRRAIRLLSLMTVLVGISATLVFTGFFPSPIRMFEFFFSGISILLCCHLPHENHVRHPACSGCILAVSLALNIAGAGPGLYVLLHSICIVSACILFINEKHSQPRFFFCSNAVWHSIEDAERSVLLAAALVLAMLFQMSVPEPSWMQWTTASLAALYYVFLYLYLYYGWYVLVGKPMQAEIKRNMRGQIRVAMPARNDEETRRMESLFVRVKDLMETGKPYLDPDFTESEMASLVFSNQNYLSRTVNALSGMNFKQFLNSYRVQYAEDMMKKDPRAQVKELAAQSGFNSTPSFNMAFKLFRGMTPGRYMKEMLVPDGATVHERPSSLWGKER